MICLYIVLVFTVNIIDTFAQFHDWVNEEAISRIKRQNSDIHLSTIIMKADNFDNNNNKTWIMRFYNTNKHFKPNGPLFILNGGEQSITPFPLEYSLMTEIAKQNGAHMVNLEHRYYGESLPDSYFQHLTVDQALADMAYFIQEYKRVRPEFKNSKVVIFGTSYSGTLAIWMRLKYPELVHAVMSSSAPVVAKVNFHEYWEEIYKLLGQECLSSFINVENHLKNILQQPNGAEKIKHDFNITGPISLKRLQYMLQGNMLHVVNQNQCGSLSQTCVALTSPKQSDYGVMTVIRRKHNVRKQFLNKYYDNNQNYLAWFYQLCTQFGFFQSNRLTPLEKLIYECQRTFGPEFTQEVLENGVRYTNDNFGGQNIHVTRIVAIYGTGDPWHVLGLRSSSDPLAPVIYVNGTAHGKDVYPINPKCDNQQMIDAKYSVVFYINKWLKEN